MRQGRQPIRAAARLGSIRSRWSLNIVKNFTIFRIRNTNSRFHTENVSLFFDFCTPP
jgi:hypothetical protein